MAAEQGRRKSPAWATIKGQVYACRRFQEQGQGGETWERCKVGVMQTIPGMEDLRPVDVYLRGDRVPASVVPGALVEIGASFTSNNDPLGRPYINGFAVEVVAAAA
jgi:hypothetical protein